MSHQRCFSSHQNDGIPRGALIKLHGLNTYAVEPPEDRPTMGIIVIIPDAFGVESLNNRLLADTYATMGSYKVYLPDFMLGHSCPSWFLDTLKALMAPGGYLMKPYHVLWAMYAFIPWLYHNRHTRTFSTVKAFFEALRSDTAGGSALPIGVAGFSWGGKHTILLTHEENYLNLDGTPKPMLEAAFIGHPISVDIPTDFEKITVPTSFAIPENDHHVKAPADTNLLSDIMNGKPVAQRGEVIVYAGCAHGFCTRSDFLSVQTFVVEAMAVEAESQAVGWFKSRLQPAGRPVSESYVAHS